MGVSGDLRDSSALQRVFPIALEPQILEASYSGGTVSSQSWGWTEQGRPAWEDLGKKGGSRMYHPASLLLSFHMVWVVFRFPEYGHGTLFIPRMGRGTLFQGGFTQLISPPWAPDVPCLSQRLPSMGRKHWSAWATPFFLPGRQPHAKWDAVASYFLCDSTILIQLSLCHQTAQQLLHSRAQWANPLRGGACQGGTVPPASPRLLLCSLRSYRGCRIPHWWARPKGRHSSTSWPRKLREELDAQGLLRARRSGFLCLPIHHKGLMLPALTPPVHKLLGLPRS